MHHNLQERPRRQESATDCLGTVSLISDREDADKAQTAHYRAGSRYRVVLFRSALNGALMIEYVAFESTLTGTV